MSSLSDKIKSVFGGGDHSSESHTGDATHTSANPTHQSGVQAGADQPHVGSKPVPSSGHQDLGGTSQDPLLAGSGSGAHEHNKLHKRDDPRGDTAYPSHQQSSTAGHGHVHTGAGTSTDDSRLATDSHGRPDTSRVPGTGVATGPGTEGGIHASELGSDRSGSKPDDFTSGLEGTRAGNSATASGLTGSQYGTTGTHGSGLTGAQHGTSGLTGSSGNQYGTPGTQQSQYGSHSNAGLATGAAAAAGAGALAGRDRDSYDTTRRTDDQSHLGSHEHGTSHQSTADRHDRAFPLGTGSHSSTSNTTSRDTTSNPLSSGTSSNLREGDNTHRDRHLGEGAAGAGAAAAAGYGASKLGHHDDNNRSQNIDQRDSSSSTNPLSSRGTAGNTNTSSTTGNTPGANDQTRGGSVSGSGSGGAGALGGVTATPQEQTIAGGKDPQVVAASQPTTHKSGSMLDIGDAATGPAHKTAGPHKSDALNKLDPRVDSDLDGSKTVGNAPQTSNTTQSGSTSHTGRNAGLAGAGAGAGAAYAAHEHNKHGEHSSGLGSSDQRTGAGIGSGIGSGTDSTYSQQRPGETGHTSHTGRDAGMAAAGAGAAYAAHGHNTRDTERGTGFGSQSAVDPTRSTSGVNEPGHSHFGRDAGLAGAGAGAAYAAHEHNKHGEHGQVGSGIDPTHSDGRSGELGHSTGGIAHRHRDEPTSAGHTHHTTKEDYNDPSGHHHESKLLGFLHHNKADQSADATGSSLPGAVHPTESGYDTTRSGQGHTGRDAALAGVGAAGAGYGASRLAQHHNEPSIGQREGLTGTSGLGSSTGGQSVGSTGPYGTSGASGLTSATGTTAEGSHGPHSSRIANAADPRVDSDRDGSRAIGSTTGTGTSGLSSSQGTSGLGSSRDGSGLTGAGHHDSSHTGRDLAGVGAAAGAGYGASRLGQHGNTATQSQGNTSGDYNQLSSGTPSGVSGDARDSGYPSTTSGSGNTSHLTSGSSHAPGSHGDYNTLSSGTPSGVSLDDQRASHTPHTSTTGGSGVKDTLGLGSGSGTGLGSKAAAAAAQLRSEGKVTHNCHKCGEPNDITKYFNRSQ